MTKHKYWNSGIIIFSNLNHFNKISNHYIPAIFFRNKSHFFWTSGSFSMSSMIICKNDKTIFIQKFRKVIISFTMFCHAMSNNNYCPNFFFRNPFKVIYFCAVICYKIFKCLCHLPSIKINLIFILNFYKK